MRTKRPPALPPNSTPNGTADFTAGFTAPKGRGSSNNPGNRFERQQHVQDPSWLDEITWEEQHHRQIKTHTHRDTTQSILSKNDSPDLGLTHTLNPYRGCEHGCIYCYARPSHEYWGFSAGIDFETQIIVKHNAPQLLAKALSSKRWKGQPIALSGNTDCYQPLEKKLEITRQCLEVLLQYRNPVAIITKSALVLRDLDILQALAAQQLVVLTLSITTLDGNLARTLEPRAASPQRRLFALEQAAAAGIPVSVNVAPIIPGLNEHEFPSILDAAAKRGAQWADYTMLRLPLAVKPLFLQWLQQHAPDKADKVRKAIQAVRGGALNDVTFGSRMRGEGLMAEFLSQWFSLHCKKAGLNQRRFGFSIQDLTHKRPAQSQQLAFHPTDFG